MAEAAQPAFEWEPKYGPTAHLPGILDIYSVHPPDVLRPAVAFAAELAGVEPNHMVGKTLANYQLGVVVGLINLNASFGDESERDLAQKHTKWIREREACIMVPPFDSDYVQRLNPATDWPRLAGAVLAATEPYYPQSTKTDLRMALGFVLPKEVAIRSEAPSVRQQKELLERYGHEAVQRSAVGLTEEIFINTSLITLYGLSVSFARRVKHMQAGSDGLSRLCREVNYASGRLHPNEPITSWVSRIAEVTARIKGNFELLGYELGEPGQLSLPEKALKSIGMLTAITQGVGSLSEARTRVRIEAHNSLQSYYAEAVQQEHAALEAPYSFVSKKELRNSPYWSLCSVLTGHHKQESLTSPIDQQQAAEIAGTLRRIGTLLCEANDPDAALARMQQDLAEECSLAQRYGEYRAKATSGAVPQASMNSIRQRYQDLIALWPKMRKGVEHTLAPQVFSRQQLDDLDVLFAMIA